MKYKYHVGYCCGPSELTQPDEFCDNVVFFGITAKSSSQILDFCNNKVAKMSDIDFKLCNFMYEPLKISPDESKKEP